MPLNIGKTLGNFLRNRDRPGIGKAAIIKAGAGDDIADQIDIGGRQTRTDQRIGTLLVNPGGPGASGVDFIRDSADYAVDSELAARYDVVGFDPRGVDRSNGIRCVDDAFVEEQGQTFGTPELPSGDDIAAELTERFGS